MIDRDPARRGMQSWSLSLSRTDLSGQHRLMRSPSLVNALPDPPLRSKMKESKRGEGGGESPVSRPRTRQHRLSLTGYYALEDTPLVVRLYRSRSSSESVVGGEDGGRTVLIGPRLPSECHSDPSEVRSGEGGSGRAGEREEDACVSLVDSSCSLT